MNLIFRDKNRRKVKLIPGDHIVVLSNGWIFVQREEQTLDVYDDHRGTPVQTLLAPVAFPLDETTFASMGLLLSLLVGRWLQQDGADKSGANFLILESPEPTVPGFHAMRLHLTLGESKEETHLQPGDRYMAKADGTIRFFRGSDILRMDGADSFLMDPSGLIASEALYLRGLISLFGEFRVERQSRAPVENHPEPGRPTPPRGEMTDDIWELFSQGS